MKNRREKVVDPGGGANQSRVRVHNERLVLSLVQRHGSLPKSEIARRSGLSAQTVTVIMRELESEGLLVRGEPQRGKVGQPSIPMSLNPDGVFSIGLKIGRRSADFVLVDFLGRERQSFRFAYAYPMPEDLLSFANKSLDRLYRDIDEDQMQRITGIGVSMPFELWNWAEKVGAPQSDMDIWHDVDFRKQVEVTCGLPTFLQNDATSACGAELVFGHGSEFSDFVYLFVGTFIGGGIVLNHSLFSGRTGYAGAFGPMPVINNAGIATPLIDHASIYTLETMLNEQNIDASPIWLQPEDWSAFGIVLDNWIDNTAKHLALAIISACAVIDFEAAVIDGGFPKTVRAKLVAAIRCELKMLDLRGIVEPQILEGKVGSGARALGGASLPLFARYLLDKNALYKGIE